MRLPRPFYRLPVHFDVERLRAEIAALPPDAWHPHPNGGAGNFAVRLISGEGGENDEVNGVMRMTPHLERSPYMRQVLASFGVVWSRSRLLRLAQARILRACLTAQAEPRSLAMFTGGKFMTNEGAIRREVGAIALMFTGLGSIIGSGWLFGAWRAAQLAGPGAIYAWIIGAVVISFVAITYAELGAMFPESGGAVRYGHYSHGSLVGFVAGWSAWIAIVSVIPVEAEASVQYMSSWPWAWAQHLYVHAANGQGELTVPGLCICAALVVMYFLVNFWSVKVFAGTNSAITFFKLIVPAATAIALMCTGFHAENFRVGIHGGPHVGNIASILTAVATSGIVFSYNGFQSPVNLAGEAHDPGRSVPFAIFGSIALSTVVYLMLQIAFLGAVAPEHLHEGWAALEYSSPFAQLALALNLNWLALLLYADAFVSPSGTGTTYTATTARMIYAMERSGTFPRVFGRVHPRFGIPRPAMWFNLAGVVHLSCSSFAAGASSPP